MTSIFGVWRSTRDKFLIRVVEVYPELSYVLNNLLLLLYSWWLRHLKNEKLCAEFSYLLNQPIVQVEANSKYLIVLDRSSNSRRGKVPA